MALVSSPNASCSARNSEKDWEISRSRFRGSVSFWSMSAGERGFDEETGSYGPPRGGGPSHETMNIHGGFSIVPNHDLRPCSREVPDCSDM